MHPNLKIYVLFCFSLLILSFFLNTKKVANAPKFSKNIILKTTNQLTDPNIFPTVL